MRAGARNNTSHANTPHSQAPDPADIKAVCDNDKVKSYISSKCGDNTDAANKYYADVCKDAGVTVSTSESSSKSGSHSASATGTHGSQTTLSPSETLSGVPLGTAGTASSGFHTATTNGTWSAPTASSTGGSSASQTTGAGGAQSTGAASRLGMDVVGLAAVGVFGAMLAL